MNRRRAIAVVVLAVLAVAAAVGGRWYWPRPPTPAPAVPAASPSPSPAVVPAAPPRQFADAAHAEARSSATRLARLFAERFGTFSSQGREEGIAELSSLMTDRLQRRVEAEYLPDLRRRYPASGPYSGQTARVLSVAVGAVTDQGASVTVHLQQEVAGAAGDQVTYPTLLLTIVRRPAGEWLVDEAVWGALP